MFAQMVTSAKLIGSDGYLLDSAARHRATLSTPILSQVLHADAPLGAVALSPGLARRRAALVRLAQPAPSFQRRAARAFRV